mmetsp:Transcript_1911/g.5668  ORF Transcript_1911/g.5668 Transcript_1911/m.5668 type:complete len:271 (-) Transcript_1911:15-827(-)
MRGRRLRGRGPLRELYGRLRRRRDPRLPREPPLRVHLDRRDMPPVVRVRPGGAVRHGLPVSQEERRVQALRVGRGAPGRALQRQRRGPGLRVRALPRRVRGVPGALRRRRRLAQGRRREEDLRVGKPLHQPMRRHRRRRRRRPRAQQLSGGLRRLRRRPDVRGRHGPAPRRGGRDGPAPRRGSRQGHHDRLEARPRRPRPDGARGRHGRVRVERRDPAPLGQPVQGQVRLRRQPAGLFSGEEDVRLYGQHQARRPAEQLRRVGVGRARHG